MAYDNSAKDLKDRVDIVDIIRNYVKLNKIGTNYIGLCPFHEDSSPSFNVSQQKQFYKCFGCGEGGDVFNFLMKQHGIDFKGAVDMLKAGGGMGNPVITREKEKPRPKWEIITPVPENAPAPPDKLWDFKEKKFYKIDNLYHYYNEDLLLVGCTARINKPNGKEVKPLSYCTDGTNQKWVSKAPDRPTLYGLEQLKLKPNAKILMVEGEKCKDAAQKIFKDNMELIPMSWLGGTQRVLVVAWEPIKNRTIIYWPDADTHRNVDTKILLDEIDQPGNCAMLKINNLIKTPSKIIKREPDKVNGWDVADAVLGGWGVDSVKAYMIRNMVTFDDFYKIKNSDTKKETQKPYQPLGYNASRGNVYYYYLPNGTNKVIELSPTGHNKMNLLSIAPLHYWEREYPMKSQPDYTLIANDCMRDCERKGIYDPFRVRGRGAWFDTGRVVLHMGDKLIVDEKETDVSDIDSYYIYESGLPIEKENYGDPLPVSESKKLVDICKLFSWEYGISSNFLAGWLALAHIGGAVDWRPHIWITGESGSGKSWIYDNVVTPLLGRFSLNLSSSSTEAGIRCMLGNDAMPVYKDENEAETKEAFYTLMRILELVRQASSNKDSKIVKGTASGGSVAYCIRSPFLFVSINAKLIQQSDESRFSLLKLTKRPDYVDGSAFEQVKHLVMETITKSWCAKLRARCAKMIPTIRKNIDVFVDVVSKKLCSNRHGEQIGTLLAGCYSLVSDGVISFEEARELVDKVNWENEANIKSTTDQEKLLCTICEQLVVHGSSKEHVDVGTLVRKASFDSKPTDYVSDDSVYRIEKKESLETLRKYGVSVVKNRDGVIEVVFAEKHSKLEGLLKNTPWNNGYHLVLARFKGAQRKLAAFSGGIRYQCIAVPYENIMTEKEYIEDDRLDVF